MRMPGPRRGVRAAPPQINRKGAEGEAADELQAEKSDAEMVGAEAPDAVKKELRCPGRPLELPIRSFFEPRFGADFADVSVHHDERAAGSARAVGAQAYTVANHIVFGSGRYAPEVEAGRRLLAHELAHVVQHRASPSIPVLRRAPATYGNLYPGDVQGGARIVQLEETGGLWYEIGPKGDRFRAEGVYDFVVKDDKVFALKNAAWRGNVPHRPGHLTLAGQGRVEYAGHVTFGTNKQERGILIEWSNSSGHIAPTGGGTNAAQERLLERVPFPKDRFKRTVPQNVPRRGPQLPVFQPETKPRAGAATQTAGKADAASTTGNATRAEQTASKTERAAAEADHAATAATKTTVKAETSTARRGLTSAFELGKIGALDAADFYLQLHAAHFAALEAVSEHVEVAKTLLAHIAEFESGARTLRQRVDRAWRDEAITPGDPLGQGEGAVTIDDIETVTAVRDAASRVANDAFHARLELDAILKGWDAATTQATTTADFTRQAVNDATAELDLRFAKEEGGSFRAYLAHARSDAARVEYFAGIKWRIANDILETTDIQQLRYERAKEIQNRERTEAATRADRPQDILRFTRGNVKVTAANLLAWALRNYPGLATDPKVLKTCLMNIYASQEFAGSESAREGAAMDLVLRLREGF
jgi:hypothetical protein